MNNKIFIGSIIAVTILIGVSYTSVGGYRSVTFDTKASPLFNIRTSRVVDEESEDFNCDYIGKGIENNIFIPKRTDGISPFLKFIYSLIKISENVHNPKINNILQQYNHNGLIEVEQISELENKINNLNKELDILDKISNPLASTNPPTGVACCLTASPPILCKIFGLIIAILVWLGIL